MALVAGQRLGPYEILGPIGAGAMGEVYRARDPRLARNVALKILPDLGREDPQRLRRFEQEARAVGALSHPNVVAVHDAGVADGTPYLVAELLVGETLRARITRDLIPRREVLELAVQITRGLAAAHDKGVVHRDLKPANIFVTDKGQVKLLDFGLAKVEPARGSDGELAVQSTLTASGAIIGTVAYMAPEQVRGRAVDARSDLFAFGVVLYEMATGERPFHGTTSLELGAAILESEPPSLGEAGLDAVVKRCLAKDPAARFQSAHEVLAALETLVAAGSSPTFRAEGPAAGPAHEPRTRRRPWLVAAALAGTGVGGLALGLLTPGREVQPTGAAATPAAPALEWTPLTFRHGQVASARFASDGKSAVYTLLEHEDSPTSVQVTTLGRPESRELHGAGTALLAVSLTGELAILQDSRVLAWYLRIGTLATVPITGGGPRPLATHVMAADWLPDGTLAAARGDRSRDEVWIEAPLGRKIHSLAGGRLVGGLRVGPDGGSLALLDNQSSTDDAGVVVIIDRDGKVLRRSESWGTLQGLAWTPDGREVWFAGGRGGEGRSIWAMDVASGRERRVAAAPVPLVLHDIDARGRALVTSVTERVGNRVALGPGQAEREIGWFNSSGNLLASSDASQIVISEHGEATGGVDTIFLRRTDGSPAVQLATELVPVAISPDGGWVAAVTTDGAELRLVPTGPGEIRRLATGGLTLLGGVAWFPDGKSLVLFARGPGEGPGTWTLRLDGSAPKKLVDGLRPALQAGVAPDGKHVILAGPDGWSIAGVEDGAVRKLPGLEAAPEPGESPGSPSGWDVLGWTSDSRALNVTRRIFGRRSADVERYDLDTGAFSPVRTINAADGAFRVLWITADAKAYVYKYVARTSRLYLLESPP